MAEEYKIEEVEDSDKYGDEDPLFDNRADDEELVKKVQEACELYHQRYKSDRTDIDQKNKVADYMYACAQNRALLSSEKSKGMNLEKDTRSNVGSTLFFRQVNQLASQLVNVMQSKPDLWEYQPSVTTDVDVSAEVGISRINMANALARWTRRQSGFDEKIPEFAVMLFKYSNIFIGVRQVREVHMTRCSRPIYEPDENGVPVLTGSEQYIEEKVHKNFPEFFFPHPDMFWADKYVPTVQKQNCVIFGNPTSMSELWAESKLGYFSEKQYKEISANHKWQGSDSSSVRGNESTNRETQISDSSAGSSGQNDKSTGLYMKWDVWIRAPIDDSGKWDDDKNPPKLYWATFIGNTIGEGVCVRLMRNNEPDDEIPFKEIRCQPDNSDSLYHTHNSDIVRSAYSADCTLLNLALDNMALSNEPPLIVVDGAHRVRDFTFRKGQKWHVDRPDAITQMQTRDSTGSTSVLRQAVRAEAMQALATDPAMLGEFAGARTSATEWQGVNSNTRQPHLLQVRYILHQLLPWMARKLMRYWDEFGLPSDVATITHQDKQYKISPKEVTGNFDIEISIIDEFEDSMLAQQRIQNALTLIGNVPYYQQSPHHTIDPSELLKAWFDSMKWPSPRIILPPDGADATQVATSRVNGMLNAGQYVSPQQGENFAVHLRVASAERLRWKGLEDVDDPRAKNLPLLDQYIAELKQVAQGGQTAAAAAPNGNLSAGTQNQSEGEAAGNQIASAYGGMGGSQ